MARPDPDDVPIRPAATVVVVRDAVPSGVEVLVLRRTTSAVFAAGTYVFPGGRVDEADGAPDVAAHCVGLDDAGASRALGVDEGGLSFWVAAVRECLEESGLLLGRRRNGAPFIPSDDERRAVHRGELTLAELCRRHDLVLDLSALRYIAHWVTPVGEPRRFDTRFFLALAPEGQDGVHDDAELIDSQWVRPAEALAQVERRELRMLPPTIACLRTLIDSASVADALAAADAADPPPRIEGRLKRNAAGKVVGIILPGEPDFDL